MSQDKCRWGMMSTAGIGQKNWQAINLSGNGIVAAVASRNLESSKNFISECQKTVPFDSEPEAIEGYENLIARDDIDAVYIPLPTGLRKEWVIKAAQSGKHVLCEKPCAIDANDLREMIEACEANSVQFMDGVMYMHSRRLDAVRDQLSAPGAVGDIRRITSQFSFNAPPEFKTNNIRTNSLMEPHGCLGDLGWYTIRFALWVLDFQLPTKVSGRILSEHQRDGSPEPVPMEFSGELFFENGVSSGFYNSFQTEHQQWANVSGTEGFLHINDFVLPYSNQGSDQKDANDPLSFVVSNSEFVVEGCDFAMNNSSKTIEVKEGSHSTEDSQETMLFRKFGEQVLSKTIDSHWSDAALKTQLVLDACFQSARNGGELVTIGG